MFELLPLYFFSGKKMRSEDRTRGQRLNEPAEVRQQIEGLETSEAERKRAEEALKQSQEWLAAIFEASRDGIVVEEDEYIVYANRSYALLYGYDSPEELLGKHLSVVQAPEDNERMLEFGRKRLRGEPTPSVYEFKGIRKDGTLIDLEASVSTSIIAGKAYIITVVRDIAERKQAQEALRKAHEELEARVEERTAELTKANAILKEQIEERARAEDALRKSEAKNRALFNAIPDPMFQISRDGIYLDFKTGKDFEPLLHPSEFLGKSVYDVMPEEVAQQSMFYVRKTLESGDTQVFEYQLTINDGRRNFEARFVPSGETEVLAIVRDITERKQAEEERAQLLAREQAARAEAEEASRAKDDFLAVLSHELRTPLTPIIGWCTILRDKYPDDRAIAMGLDVMERNARHQAKLIEDLLDVSRIVSGKLSMEKRSAEIGEVVKNCVQSIRSLADAKGVGLGFEASPEPIFINGDTMRLQQAVTNLLTNAIKFTNKGGQVLVKTAFSNGVAEIIVQDDGIGIDPEFLPRIFDRFQQAESAVTRKYGGLGLGLTIVKYVAEAHGGQIEAHSDGVGRGATFVLRIPPNMAELSTSAAEAQAEASQAPQSLNILIVEDSPDNLEILKLLLEAIGHRVIAADSAKRAKELALRERPDLILADLGMPDVSDFEMIREFRSMKELSNVPAIAISGYGMEEDIQMAYAAGFQAHILKPVSREQLAEKIAAVARKRVAPAEDGAGSTGSRPGEEKASYWPIP